MGLSVGAAMTAADTRGIGSGFWEVEVTEAMLVFSGEVEQRRANYEARLIRQQSTSSERRSRLEIEGSIGIFAG